MSRPDWSLITFAAANVAAILLIPDTLFIWLLVVDLIAGGLVLGAMYLAAEQRADRGEDVNVALRVRTIAAEQKAVRLQAELDVAYESLGAVLDEHALCPAPTVLPLRSALRANRPDLRAVPAQRRSPDEEWNDLARAIEDETGGGA